MSKMVTRRTKERLKGLLSPLFVGVFFILLIFSYFSKGFKKNEPLNSPSVASNVSSKSREYSTLSLEATVKDALAGTQGSYGIVVKSLKTPEVYFLNEHKSFNAASLYKLWVMAESFKQIQDGDLKEDEVLSEDVSVLNNAFNLSEGEAELTEGKITLSVSDALNQMITISHNYAALLLTERIKLSSINSFLSKNGFFEVLVGTGDQNPTTTASDIALFLEKLYKGELANQENTNKMLDLLKRQQLNNKLPRFLPEGLVIAHKTGEIASFTHDSGIVFTQKGDYIIVVLSDTDMPSAAEDRISQISKNVYEYFTKGGEDK